MAALGRVAARLIPVLVAGTVVAAVLTLPAAPTRWLSVTDTSQAALTAALAAGGGLVVAGVVAGGSRGGAGLSLALAVAASAWLAPELVAREDAPGLVRALAGLVAPALAPALLHATLTVSSWPRPSVRRLLVLAGYAVVATASLLRMLVWDPGLDANCWSNCTSNVLLLEASPPLAGFLTLVLDGWTVLLAVGVAVTAVKTWTAASDTRNAAWVTVPLTVASLAVAAHAALRMVRPFETPLDMAYVRQFHARAWTLTAVVVGVTVLVLLDVRRRLLLNQVLRQLADVARGRSLQDLLRAATGDDDLVVLYPGADADEMLDTDGRRHPRPRTAGPRVATPLVRGEREVAVVVHDGSRVSMDELRRAAGPVVRLAVDNERLRAELLLRLDELQASRARVVTAGDARRRELERDLHDGAQHRLLALGHDVRRAREAAGQCDAEVEAALGAADREMHAAAVELRAVGRGLYPAMLTAEGLREALWSLSDSAPVPLEIPCAPGRRYAEAIERTVYAVAAEAVEASAREGADRADVVTLDIREHGAHLMVQVAGVLGGPPVRLVDRVGAVGGTLDSSAEGWRVKLPCE